MALTESNPIEIGTQAPDFNLLDTTSGNNKSLTELKGKNGTVIMFICNHCPFVIHVNNELVKLANDYIKKELALLLLVATISKLTLKMDQIL